MGNLTNKIFAKVSFYYMSKGLNILAKHDVEVMDRLEIVPIGYVIAINILGQKERLTMVRTDKGFAACKDKRADLTITFKFFKSLPNIVFGKQSVTQSYLNNEFFVAGELRYAVAMVFTIEKFMAYLLPKKLYSKVYGRVADCCIKKVKMFGKLLFARRETK